MWYMKTYFKVLATLLLTLAAFPAIVFFFGLFFYTGDFAVTQVLMQVGVQLILFTLVYMIVRAIGWVWK